MIEDIKDVWKKKMNKEGLKFFVLNADDLFKLSPEMIRDFNTILYKIEEDRIAQGKTAFNTYFIVNRDEEYADEVAKIIEKNENVKLQD